MVTTGASRDRSSQSQSDSEDDGERPATSGTRAASMHTEEKVWEHWLDWVWWDPRGVGMEKEQSGVLGEIGEGGWSPSPEWLLVKPPGGWETTLASGMRNEVKVGFATPSGATGPQEGDSERRDFGGRGSPRPKSRSGVDSMQA